MKTSRLYVMLFFYCLCVGRNIAQDQLITQTVRGVVVDDQSGHPLSQVTVFLENVKTVNTVIADSLGRFKLLHIPIGRQSFRFIVLGYETGYVQNVEVTSAKEVVLEIRLKEKINRLIDVVVTSGRQKYRAINELAVVSARQLSIDEAVRYSGTRNDPSRMAQQFAGVSGINDARNDIVIRGNSPCGVLWRMEGIDIPNPNHFNTMGATGGPVTMLNTNVLKNSDFITSAFPAQYGNALSGVFDLRMRNGNNENYEYLGEMGFNGFEFGAEGPLRKKSQSSFLVDYRYSMVAAIQALGLNVGTGNATPYYQDAAFKMHIVTKKTGTFDWFGLGGESHIYFPPDSTNNFYVNNAGGLSNQNSSSLTGITGLIHTMYYNANTSGKFTLALSGAKSTFYAVALKYGEPKKTINEILNIHNKFSVGYSINKKINSRNQLTAGIITDFNFLNLHQKGIPHGDSVLKSLILTNKSAILQRVFMNYFHRFGTMLSTNVGLYVQEFDLNHSSSIEPRWNLKYQFQQNQSFSLGAGLHSQMQPLEIYFLQTADAKGNIQLTNRDLGFVKSVQTVAGYDISLPDQIRIKAEVYAQFMYDAAVESKSSSFSLLNAGAGFGFPDSANLVNRGKGLNKGVEITLEKFLQKGFYYLFTASIFQSTYAGSDGIWRSTAFNSNYVFNILGGKEWRIEQKSAFGVDSKLTVAGGQRYTDFDLVASKELGYVVYKDNEAYALQNNIYLRWDLKFSYTINGKKATQKWYIDLQNLTNRKNLYMRTLIPVTGNIGEVKQIGFFPNINYQLTF